MEKNLLLDKRQTTKFKAVYEHIKDKGVISIYRKGQLKYSFDLRIIPDQSLAFLEYRFYDSDGKELDMKEETEMK